MKKIIITLILVFTGSVGFAQNTETVSKCQSFVSGVFSNYNLPLPGTVEFPVHRISSLENYDQAKPEFTIMTAAVEIKKSTSNIINNTQIVNQKNHLKFEGKILEDGSYVLIVSE